MSYGYFLSAVLALLLAPGPTNTLMALAGAQKGFRRVVYLLPAESLGYLTTVLPLSWVGFRLFEQWPAAEVALKILAAAWVMYLALKLWGSPLWIGENNQVTARRVYVTTVLNPKALIFGLVLLPAPLDALFLPRLGLLCLAAMAVAVIWGVAGALTHAGAVEGRRIYAAQRFASVWLASVSVALLASLFRS